MTISKSFDLHILSFNNLINDSTKKKKFIVAGNHEYQETDILNSEKSSLKSEPFVGNPVS